MHRNCTLHLGDLHAPFGRSAIGRKGPEWDAAVHHVPRNQSSSREHSGHGWSIPFKPNARSNWEIIAVSSGSDSNNATLRKEGSAVKSSSPEGSSPLSDAVIDIRSSAGAPNEMLGPPWDRGDSPGRRVTLTKEQLTH
ncbi:hypothetical protein PO909_014459 [Leuciscus waleckii]